MEEMSEVKNSEVFSHGSLYNGNNGQDTEESPLFLVLH
jgi:hypothetical protein